MKLQIPNSNFQRNSRLCASKVRVGAEGFWNLNFGDSSEFGTWNPEHRKSRGFTLIELMTVIVLIGILTAMILPEMRGTYEDALLRTTSRDLVSVFELASSRAISLNQLHRVRLDTQEGRYLVERRIRVNGAEDFVPLKDVSGCSGELDKRIAIQIHRADEDQSVEMGEQNADQNSEQAETISFYPDGTADAALILLQDRQGFRLALRLNPITSRVNVLEMDRE